MINVFRGFKYSSFDMTELTLDALGLGDTFKSIYNTENLENIDKWVLPLPTGGMWNCTSDHSIQSNIFRKLEDGGYDYLKLKGAILCLDAAGEGLPINDTTLRHMHSQLALTGLPPSRIIYLTSAVFGGKDYYGWCAENHLSPAFTPVPFHVQLYYLSGMYRKGGLEGHEQRYAKFFDTVATGKIREKHYLSLNYSPRPSRYALALYLLKHDLINKGVLSFFGPTIDNGPMDAAWKDISFTQNALKQLGVDEDLIELIPSLHALCPLKINDGTGDTRVDLAYNIQDTAPYESSYFSVVTESDFSAHSGFRLTEKSFKPLVNCHPFVLLGQAGSLRELRRLGFKTFDGFIDESYDEVEDDQKRMNMVFAEISRLCAMPIAEIHNHYVSLWPILSHNYAHFSFGIRAQALAEPGLKMMSV